MLWEILVPTQMNGLPISLEHHQAWDAYVRGISGGLTILRPAKGQWVDPNGKFIAERMIPVRVLCNKTQMQEIARFTKKHYVQQAVLAYCLSNEIIIVKDKDSDVEFIGQQI